MTILCLPRSSTISALPRIAIDPRPVLYASRIASCPRIVPPVGKSGPLTMSQMSSSVADRDRRSTRRSRRLISLRLCGGMLVAMPDRDAARSVDRAAAAGVRAGRSARRLGCRSWERIRRSLYRCRPRRRARSAPSAPRCSGKPPAGPDRSNRSFRGRRPADSEA